MDHRLSRRGLLAGFLAAATLTACDGTPIATPTAAPSFTPPADVPLATWELVGGFAVAGMAALRPPRLVVYGDGDAIADAAYRSRLDPEALQSLASSLANDLRTTPAQRKPTAAPTIVDAPVTKVTVWSPAGVLTFSAEGMDELKPDHLYADVFYDARDRLAAVHKSVSATAQPYLATRVRVVAVPALDNTAGNPGAGSGGSVNPTPDPSASASVTAWPADVRLPSPNSEGLRRADLDGDAARVAVRMLTRDLDQRGAWPTYRMPDGTLIRASWRYLLPNE